MERVLGVALLIVSPAGRIFCLEELQDKVRYEKYSGMISFPIETMEDGEGREHALERLLTEEVGSFLLLSDPHFLGEVDVDYLTGEKSKIFCYLVFSPEEFEGSPGDTDVQFFGWKSFEEVVSFCENSRRREVLPVFRLFQMWAGK